MNERVAGNTGIARTNAANAVKLAADQKRAMELMQAAVKALADAIDELNTKR